MASLGKIMVIAGLLAVALGLIMMLGGRIDWLGRIPGDITVKRENFTFYFPLATCLLISVILTLLIWFFKK